MYMADTTVLSKDRYPGLFGHLEGSAELSKCLYNAALFRIRQVFTGWDKEDRSENEKEVFREIAVMKEVYPDIKAGRVLSYRALDAVMRANRNPDFFAGLPMQTAQRILKEAVSTFKGWLSAVKGYKKAPGRFTGRPRMPKYLKNGVHTFYISSQDAVLYPVYRDIDTPDSCADRTEGPACRGYAGMELKLPLIRERLYLPHIHRDSVLKEVQVKPYYGKIMLVLVLETEEVSVSASRPHAAGIDLGTDNIAAIVSTDHASRIYKGGAVLSENRSFHKKRARAVSIMTKGKKHRSAESARLRRLSLHHDGFMRDMMHKISTDIIRYCVEHGVGTLVIGTNRGWKQGADMGKANDQNFVSVPHDRLRKGEPVFSGKRTARGLYACSRGYSVNADCNAAANILRKAVPGAWEGTEDFRFLAHPETMGFKALQRARTA